MEKTFKIKVRDNLDGEEAFNNIEDMQNEISKCLLEAYIEVIEIIEIKITDSDDPISFKYGG